MHPKTGLYWIVYQSSHKVRRGQIHFFKSRQVFKVKNRNKKSRNSRTFRKTFLGNLVKEHINRSSINAIRKIEVCCIRYESSHIMRRGQNLSKSRQVFKIENRKKTFEIPKFSEQIVLRKIGKITCTVKPCNARTFRSRKSALLTVGQH